MKLRFEALAEQLAQPLAPIYYISGNEPFQLGLACDQIRQAARKQGYDERHVFYMERGFDWSQILYSTESLSLFASRKLIELRVGAAKPGVDGGKVLQHYAEQPAADCVLLMSGDKLEPAQQKSAWYTAIERCGVVVPVWPIDAAHLPAWLGQRMRQHRLSTDAAGLQFLAEHTEGNLLAAEQEIEKLALLHAPGSVGLPELQAAVADSARFDVFALVDAALAGHGQRATRMLCGLRAEGTEPVLVLWALTREIRSLCALAEAKATVPIEQLLNQQRVWDKRKPMVRQALQRSSSLYWHCLLADCARIDRLCKGLRIGNVWNELLELSLAVAGTPTLKVG